MGCFNWFFKILGIFVMIIFVLLLPFTVLSNQVSDFFFSSDNIFSVIDEELMNTEFMEDALDGILYEMQTGEDNSEEDGMQEAISSAVDSIPPEKIIEAVETLLPLELLSDTFEQLGEGFYDWLNSDGYSTGVVINLVDLKTNIEENATDVLISIVNEMPDCDMEVLVEGWNLNCKPPEELSELVVSTIDEQVAIQLDAFPDYLSVDQYVLEHSSDVEMMRTTLTSVRDILNYVWVLVLGLLLLGIILGARTFQGFFSWAGVPMVISSIFILLIGFLLNVSTLRIINFGVDRMDVSIPGFISGPVISIADSVFSTIGTGMFWKGLIILGLGLLMIIISLLITYFRDRDSNVFEDVDSEIETLEY